jgi:hypothetical protein
LKPELIEAENAAAAGGTATRTRTGSRRSASVIISFEDAVMAIASPCPRCRVNCDARAELPAHQQPFSVIRPVYGVVDVIGDQLVEVFTISGREIGPVNADHLLRTYHQVKTVGVAHERPEEVEKVTGLRHALQRPSVISWVAPVAEFAPRPA